MIFLINLAFATPDTTHIPYCNIAPEHCSYALNAEPRATRNPNLLRFSDPELKDPELIPVLVARLLEEQDESIQIALLGLLHYQDLSLVSDSLFTITDRPSPDLRAQLVELLPYLTKDTQIKTIDKLIEDDDWLVREAVVRVIARHLGTNYPHILQRSLQDTTAEVRTQAIKGVGWNDIAIPLETLRPLLLDENPTVRLHTVRTINRIYPTKLTSLPEFTSMQNDQNPRVKREILRLNQQ